MAHELSDFDKAVNPKRERCAACGEVARGLAYVGDKRYCHPDDGPSCYVAAQSEAHPGIGAALKVKLPTLASIRRDLAREAAEPPCPNAARHTRSPRLYLQWHAWAEEMGKTHEQERCPGCHRLAIWVPKRDVRPQTAGKAFATIQRRYGLDDGGED